MAPKTATPPLITDEELQDAFDGACRMLGDFLGRELPKLRLYGDTDASKFFDISSMRDLAELGFTAMAYDDVFRGIFVNGKTKILKWHESREAAVARLTFIFMHECVHAWLSDQSHLFRRDLIGKLMSSKSRLSREKGYALLVFDEGLACYLAIRVSQNSSSPELKDIAEREAEELKKCFEEWLALRQWEWLAEFYKLDPKDRLAVILRHLERNSAALGQYKYWLGFRFFSVLNPSRKEILRFASRPPVRARHLLYPRVYTEEVWGGEHAR